MNNLRNKFFKTVMGAVAFAASVAGLSSCDAINEDLAPCPEGVSLRFVFDYNMEFANAFPSQVDCLTLLIYDADGNYITTRTETTQVLADENWRMVIDLPAGKTYHFVAYGGLECAKSTFGFVNTPAAGSTLQQLQVSMDADCIGADPGKELHPLFYGNLDMTVPAGALDYTAGTVYMMRDTNTLRILLQNVDGTPCNPDDFVFTVTDNNTLFSYDNSVIATPQGITYAPYVTGQASVGSTEEGNDAILAYAEFSLSRLMEHSGARLVITNKENGDAVLSIPLVNYLLLLRSQQFANMGNQEFLDREHRWNMILFLEHGRWIDTNIVINDWIVRLNHAEL